MGEMKPTLGEWVVAPIDGNCYEVMCDSGYYIATCHDGVRSESNAEANARLIAEAGTVFHNTGLSPARLVEMVKELKAALGGITAMCEQHGDFRNGVTDPTGTIDEGNVVAGRVIGSARAALAKCEGVGNE